MKFSHFLPVLCLLVNSAVGSPDNLTLAQKWSKSGQFLSQFVWPHQGYILDNLKKAVNDSEFKFSGKCLESLKATITGIEGQEEWAFRMIDSMGRLGPGFASGLYTDFGDYDQCLALTVSRESTQFRGKYCLFRIKLEMPLRDSNTEIIDLKGTQMGGTWFEFYAKSYKSFYCETFNVGICMPSSCSKGELEMALRKFTASAELPLRFEAYPTCDTRPDFETTVGETPFYKQMSILILTAAAVTVTICTLLSCLEFEGLPAFIKHLDAVSNTNALMKEPSEEGRKLSFVHGYRVFFLVFSIFAHVSYSSGFWVPASHIRLVVYAMNTNPLFIQMLSNIGIGVAVNFLIGGMLAYYSWHPELVKRNGNLRLMPFIVGRWFRTTPLIVATLVVIFAFPETWGSGPVFRFGFNHVTDVCLKNWWTEVFYISNLLGIKESCIKYTWYLGADFQLYLSSYLVIGVLHRKPRLGFLFIVLISFMGMLLQASLVYSTNSAPYWNLTDGDLDKLINEMTVIHLHTFNYVAPYYIGLFLGYLIVNRIEVKDKRMLLMGWMSCLLLAASVLMIPINEGSPFQKAMYNPLLKTTTATICAWICYCCYFGKAVFLSKLFSNKLLVILGRFSFSIFMGHLLFIWYDLFTTRQPVDFRSFPLLMRLSYTFFYGVILGYVFYILCEAPSANLAKALFIRKSGPAANESLAKKRVYQEKTSKIKKEG